MITRYKNNPILTPADVKPSMEGFDVFGVFNAGAINFNKETFLLLRVAEKPHASSNDKVLITKYDCSQNVMRTEELSRLDKELDFSDPRKINKKSTGKIIHLTSISHLRLARSYDGFNFQVEDKPFIVSDNEWETWGCEDARITKIGDQFWINYTAVSERGISTALAVTEDFENIDKKGIIFPAPNRDVTLFNEKIGGKFAALHRPMPSFIGTESIWFADSLDMLHWGGHRYVAEPRPGMWDSAKIGGGAPPILTEEGWVAIYHGVDEKQHYALGVLLLDTKEPWKVIGRLHEPLIKPEEIYEKDGVFSDVCFTCGSLLEGDMLNIYYGGADKVMALASVSLKELLAKLRKS